MKKVFVMLMAMFLFAVGLMASYDATDLMTTAGIDSLQQNDTLLVSIEASRTYSDKASLYATDLGDSLVVQIYASPLVDSCFLPIVTDDSLNSRTNSLVVDSISEKGGVFKYLVIRIYNPVAAVYKGKLYLMYK